MKTLSVGQQVRYTLLAMAGVTLLLGVIKFVQIRRAISAHESFARPPESVTTAAVTVTEWRDTIHTVGSFAAVKGATLSTQESGNVAQVGFESGSKVSAGQMLIELDRSVEEANLAGALARLSLAKQNLARAQALKTQSAMSVATLEEYQARVTQADAEVRSLRGVIERKTILAPFAGKAGIRVVNIGQYVTAGTPLVPLYSVDPIHFNFSVPQQVTPFVRAAQARLIITVDAFPSRTFEGVVTAVNPNINEVTRSADVQATIPNLTEELRPGMFGSVRLEVGDPKRVVTVPVSAIQYAPYGNSVYVVERGAEGANTTVRQEIVQLGAKRGDLVAVTHGLKEGDEVVTSGGFKLRPGAAIAIQSKPVMPTAENPAVQDT
jgi:membrane fusion protein (multidrug efflux system)